MLIIVDIYKTYCKLHAKLCKHTAFVQRKKTLQDKYMKTKPKSILPSIQRSLFPSDGPSALMLFED